MIRAKLKPELVNRIDEIVVFNQLEKSDLTQIVSLYVEKLNSQLKDRGVVLELTDSARAQLLDEGYDADFGARPMKRVFQKRIQDPLAMSLLSGGLKPEAGSLKQVRVEYDGKNERFTFLQLASIAVDKGRIL
jgi:ATP-dependent Clp protease ATP-binding subunit ClpA